MRFSLVGLHSAPVKVDNVRPRIVRLSPPPAGSLVDIETPPLSSGSLDVERLNFDLNGDHKIRDLIEARNNDDDKYFEWSSIGYPLDAAASLVQDFASGIRSNRLATVYRERETAEPLWLRQFLTRSSLDTGATGNGTSR